MSADVAIVDDEESVRNAWARLLRAHGLECKTYASARDFLNGLSQGTPCCVLLDLYMPDMTGGELQQELLRLGVNFPIIITTGRDADRWFNERTGVAAAAYLRKPVGQEELIGAVRAALGSFEC